MGRFKAVIFDLDDTLYPERQFVRSGFSAAARWVASQTDRSPERCAHELDCLFDRGERTRTFNAWLEAARLPQKLCDGMIAAYRIHQPTLTLHEDAREAIGWCTETRIASGLISDGYLDVQRRKVDALGLTRGLSCIVFSDEFGRASWKPSTTPYLVALEQLRLTGNEAVYIGDNPRKDFEGARRVGLKTLRVRRADGLYSADEPPHADARPDGEVATLRNLSEVLAAL